MGEFTPAHAGNGLVTLTEEQVTAIKPKLEAIRDGFSATFDEPTITTQYMVGQYIKQHEADADYIALNGDTVQHILGGAISIEPEPQPTAIEADIVG